jgi:cytochrome oxidase Cu insertion factor (SCO1/SenC/PrrC family)
VTARRAALAFACVAATAGLARSGDGGTFVPRYTLPAAGTYELPPIQTVTDHALMDEQGRETTLFAASRDRVTIVAFVYTTCAEAAGCPLSTAVLHRLDRMLADDPARDRVALVSVSFDPDRDTPARMRDQRALHAPRATWRFLTPRDAAMLDPVLADFGQRVDKLTRADGSWTGLVRHVLKVFLVDDRRRVRNIYSAGFLDAHLVLNDVRTVLTD